MTVMSGWQTLRAMQELDQRNTRGLDTATRTTRNETMSKNLITRNVTVAVAGLVIALGLAAAGPASAAVSLGSCAANGAGPKSSADGYVSDRTLTILHSQCRPAHPVAATKTAAPGTTKSSGKVQ
jgi:hypothetical protein